LVLLAPRGNKFGPTSKYGLPQGKPYLEVMNIVR
jgi:hypothetical protein